MGQLLLAALLVSAAQHFLQFTIRIHFTHDVGAAYKLAIDVQLWNGWPVGKFFNALTNVRISKHIYGKWGFYAARFQHLHCAGAKAALRELGRTFHVKYDWMAGNLIFDDVLNAHDVTLINLEGLT